MPKSKELKPGITLDIELPQSQVMVHVDGTVVDWNDNIQVNPATGEKFDFHGNRIEE